MGRLSDEEVRSWLEASCERQGVSPVITDRVTLQRVLVLLRGSEVGSLGSPNGLDAIGIEAVEASTAGADDGVIKDVLEDRSLTGEREAGPLSA